jgi:hypothetical protein
MCIMVGKIKIIDSMNFLPMPLSSMPKTFGIPELCKGYFPHLFNRDENIDYNGPYPDASYYSPSSMKPGAHEAFYKWYNENKHKVLKKNKCLYFRLSFFIHLFAFFHLCHILFYKFENNRTMLFSRSISALNCSNTVKATLIFYVDVVSSFAIYS